MPEGDAELPDDGLPDEIGDEPIESRTMTDLSNKVATVFDHGMFLEFAIRLGREGGFGKVNYATPWEAAGPKIDARIVGSGFNEIVRVDSLWDVFDETDVFCFPDSHHAALQLHLISLDKPVWGSRRGDRMELKRQYFKKLQENLGLPFAIWEEVVGLDALREYCQKNQNKFIKLSTYRGSMESWHHTDYESSRATLDSMAVTFGGIQNQIPFIVEDPIFGDHSEDEVPVESGMDLYTIDGQFPEVAVQGYEIKDRCYLASVQNYQDIPEQVRIHTEALAPLLKELRYRNWLSSEVKVLGEESVLLEPTCRQASPAGEEQLELYGNLPQIVWHGANGELIQPEVTAKFACECMLMGGDEEDWRSVVITDEVKPWVKLYNAVRDGERYHVTPGCIVIGAIVGIGDTVKEAIEHLKETAATFDGQDVETNAESLAQAVQEVRDAEDQGMEFTDQEVPEPAIAIE